MPIYELVVAESGLKMKETAAGAFVEPEDPWSPPKFTIGKDGYPVLPAGRGGLAGTNGHYLWIASNVSPQEIAKTLSRYAGRPIVDTTGLTGKYDVHLKWWIDIAWALEQKGYRDLADNLPDQGAPGLPLVRAVEDQLGLKLISGRGFGDIVVIDHLEKAPTGN